MSTQRLGSKRGFRVAPCLGAGALAASLTGVIAGCEDDFQNCFDSRTCPVTDAGNDAEGGGGTSSDAGDAGGGGSDATSDARTCTINADCIDADACNGTELCVRGFCKPGEATACESPDASHCAAECVTTPTPTGFLATCSVTALDVDGDEHGDALCAPEAVPLGDDCDDTNPEIHPAHAEVCNGIDDDCDDKIDIDDGVPLGGTRVPIVTSPAQVLALDATWSDAASSFGVAWMDTRDGANGEIYFARVDTNGNKIGGDVPVSGMISTASEDPAIAPGPDGFGVTWLEGETVYFRPFDVSGSPVAAPKIVANKTGTSPSRPDLVHDGAQGWIVTFLSNESTTSTARVVWGGRINDAGAVVQAPTSVSVTTGPYGFSSLARAGDVLLSQWADGTESGRTEIRGAYRGLLLEDKARPRISDFSEDASRPVLAASDVFFSAWWNQLDRAAVHVAIEDPNTQMRVCDKAGVAPSADGTSDVIPFSAAFDGTDFVMIHARDDGTEARLTVISKACEVVRGPAMLSPFVNTLLPQVASVAAGGGRIAVIWIEPNAAAFPTGGIMAQAFSAQYYCK